MGGIGIVSNPRSRRNRRFPEQMRRLAYVLGESDSHGMTRSVEDITTIAQRFKDTGIDILALNGGDGTNHVTLTAFIEVYKDTPLPKVALLRGGTMNTISNGIGIDGNPNSLLVNIVEKYTLGQEFEISERNLLKVTGQSKPSYGFIFGAGFIAKFLGAYYDTGAPSPTMAARLVVKVIGNAIIKGEMSRKLLEPVPLRVRADGEDWLDEPLTALAASTVEQIGLGFRPFIYCEAHPGKFHAVAILARGLGITTLLPPFRLGRPIPDRTKADDRVVRKLEIDASDTIEYTVDGDLHRSNVPITVETGPRLNVILK